MEKKQEFLKLIKPLSKTWLKPLAKYRINIAYETSTEITPRTIEVSDAFGLGVDKTRKFQIYDEFEVDIGPRDIVYITGDSGSGKSVLLRWLEKALKPNTINVKDIKPDPNRPLIDTIGATTHEGLELLSRAGLNDAFLFVRRYSELSDGQKYRYKIAKMMESGKQYWIFDEFCSLLDRDTAKIVAFNVQKLARKLGKAVLAATTHLDLTQDLKASVIVHKRFGEEVFLNYYPNALNRTCSIVREMRIEEGTYKDYEKLAGFHYRSHKVAFIRKIFILKREEEVCGAIVYTTPLGSAFGRSRVFKPKNMRELNTKLTRISRVVVHPKYRTIGAGVKLVRESLPLCGKPYVETVAVMARYNPFFERAGMQKICESKPDKSVTAAIEELKQLGWVPFMLNACAYNKTMLQGKLLQVKKVLRKMRYPFSRRIAGATGNFRVKDWRQWLNHAGPDDLANALTRLAQLNQIKVYLFWEKKRVVGAMTQLL